MIRQCLKYSLLICVVLWAGSSAIADDWIYHAQEGDTLWDLCLKYTNKRGCWIELQSYNKIKNDRKIPKDTEIRIPTLWLVNPPVVGKVLSVHGDVSYRQYGQKNAEPLKIGQPVHLGGVVLSGKGSARFFLFPHSEVQIGEETLLELQNVSGSGEKFNAVELNMRRGSIESKIEPNTGTHFQIETPAAIAAVRGTRYRVTTQSNGAESTRTEVLSGSVSVVAENALIVSSGYGVVTKKGGVTDTPKVLLPAPLILSEHMNVPLPIELKWSSSGGESAWRLELLGIKENGAVKKTEIVSEPHYEFAQLALGCYEFAVRAIDKEGFNGHENSTTLCVVPALSSVTGLTAERAANNKSQLIVQWDEVKDADRYLVEVANDSSFNTIIKTLEISAEEAIVTLSSPQGVSVRVVALDGFGNRGPVSDVIELRQEDNLMPVILLFFYWVLVII